MSIARTRIDAVSGKTLRLRGYVQAGKYPKDLTDDVIRFAIYEPDTMDVVIQKESNGGVTQGDDGVFRLVISPNDWNGMQRGEYGFEADLLDEASGDTIPLAVGVLHVTHTPL